MQQRLAQLLEAKNLTAGRFADTLNIQPSSVSHILSGRNNPSYDFIVKLLTSFEDISPEWLILGQGGMYRDGNQASATTSFSSGLQDIAGSGKNNAPADTAVKETKLELPLLTSAFAADDATNGANTMQPDKILLLYPDNTAVLYKFR